MFKFLLSILLSGVQIFASPSSVSYKLKSLNTSRVNLQRSTEKVLPIASINKLFTYFILQDHFLPNEEIQIPEIPLILNKLESKAGIQPNEIYKFSDLMHALLIPSGNDVVRALEYKLKQKNLNYTTLSKTWLSKHGFQETNIQEGIGLSSYTTSSVKDLWKLLEKVYQDQKLVSLLKGKTYTIYTISQKPLLLKNRNPLMTYKKFQIFGKTGSTKKAGFCFLGFIQNIDSREIYGIVFLGANDLEKELIQFINLLN